MPLIRSLASAYRTHVVALIFLLGKIIPIYSYCAKKRLIYVVIAALSSCQPSSCFKYTRSNMRFSYNI